MKRAEAILILALLSCCICASQPLLAHAASSSMWELEIKAKQCTLDATMAGLQQSLAIVPMDCSKRASQLLTSQTTTNTAAPGYKGVKFSIHSSAVNDKAPVSSSSGAIPSHPSKTLGPQTSNQIPMTVGISLVLALSTDALVFNMHLTQTTLRQFAKVVRFIRSRD